MSLLICNFITTKGKSLTKDYALNIDTSCSDTAYFTAIDTLMKVASSLFIIEGDIDLSYKTLTYLIPSLDHNIVTLPYYVWPSSTLLDGLYIAHRNVVDFQKKYKWIDYGEEVADLYGFGATYIPCKIWREVYPEGNKPVKWFELDTKTSEATYKLGYKAKVDWRFGVIPHLHS